MEEVKTIEAQSSEEKGFRWKTVPIDMLKRGVMEFIGSKEDLFKALDEQFNGYAEVIKKVMEEDNIEPENYALGYTFKVLPDALIWLPKEERLGVSVHEIGHSIFHIFKQVEIPITDDTEELFCYMLEYLFEQFYGWLVGKEKNNEECQ
jgi:hypothetical protein